MQSPFYPPGQPVVASNAQMTPGPAEAPPISVIDSVKFAFAGRDWKSNLLFGIVLAMIPIAGPIALMGWFAETHQRLVRRHPEPVPKFDFGDFVHYLGRGVGVFLVSLVMTLPMAIVFGVLGVVIAFGAIAGVSAFEEPLIAVLIWGAGSLVFFVFWLIMSVFLNAAQTRAELLEDFGQAFNVGKIFSYARATWAKVLVKNLVFGCVAFGIMILGMLLCYIGLYPAIVVIQIAGLHLRWQIYEHFLRNGGEPIAVKAPQWLPSEAQRYQRGY